MYDHPNLYLYLLFVEDGVEVRQPLTQCSAEAEIVGQLSNLKLTGKVTRISLVFLQTSRVSKSGIVSTLQNT